MRRRGILLLTIGVAALAVGGYFTARSQLRYALFQAGVQRIVISNLDKDEITVIRLENPSGSLVIRKKGGQWIEDSPKPVTLDQLAVDDIAWSLARLDAQRIVTEKPGPLTRYGLDSPRVVAEVELADGSQKRYLVGANVGRSDSCYFMAEGDPKLYSIGADQVEYWFRGASELSAP